MLQSPFTEEEYNIAHPLASAACPFPLLGTSTLLPVKAFSLFSETLPSEGRKQDVNFLTSIVEGIWVRNTSY